MKYFLTFTLILTGFLGYSQSPAESRIRSFLSDLQSKTWTFEKMYDDHMQFITDSMRFNKDIKAANFITMQSMSHFMELYHLNVSALVVKRDDKPKKKKSESIVKGSEYSPEPAPLTYTVYDSNKKFIWYFLLTKENRIRSILRYKNDKMFLVY